MSDSEGLLQQSKEKSKLTRTLFIATAVACMGSLQYGYHIAELNAPQQSMTCKMNVGNDAHIYKDCIDLSDQQFGAVTAIFSIGGLIGSLIAGNMADKLGRQKVAILASIINLFSSLVLFSASDFRQLFMGRVGVGFGCGLNIVITPLYINEIAPIELRGSLGTMNQLCINIGILLTQSAAIKFATVESWRYILFIGAVLAVLNMVGWFFVFESPRWLLTKNKFNLAYDSLAHLRLKPIDEAKKEIESWQREHSDSSDESNITMTTYLFDPQYSKSRWAITAILAGQQFCGINSIIFYGVKVVSQLLPRQAIIINFAISIINVIITFISSTLIDKYGRKPLLISSALVMSLMSILISASILYHVSVLLVTSIFTYIGFFAIGVGPIPFLIIGELSGKKDKALAQSYGTVCNWLATFVIGYGFPILNDMMGGYVYILFGLFALWFSSYIYYNIPETKNKSDYDEIWANY